MPKPRHPVLPDLLRAASTPPLGAEDAAGGAPGALRPIGPERLRALREAIRSGAYPSDDDVLGGLERMLDRRRRERSD